MPFHQIRCPSFYFKKKTRIYGENGAFQKPKQETNFFDLKY